MVKDISPESMIAIENIKAPILMLSSKNDTVWPSYESLLYMEKKFTDINYLYDYYWQYMDELKKRQLFIIDNITGKPIATANAWWTDVSGQKEGVVFGLSCLPEYQSKGLGRIAAVYMMDCFYRLMANCPVWLDTQILLAKFPMNIMRHFVL